MKSDGRYRLNDGSSSVSVEHSSRQLPRNGEHHYYRLRVQVFDFRDSVDDIESDIRFSLSNNGILTTGGSSFDVLLNQRSILETDLKLWSLEDYDPSTILLDQRRYISLLTHSYLMISSLLRYRGYKIPEKEKVLPLSGTIVNKVYRDQVEMLLGLAGEIGEIKSDLLKAILVADEEEIEFLEIHQEILRKRMSKLFPK